jgi:GTP-binding protein
MLPVVAIIGRPNVGKSTLFNALIGERKSIIHDMPGVTRDRIYHIAEIDNKKFLLVDTGGFILDDDKEINHHIKNQAVLAIEEADFIIALFDIQSGVMPADKELVELLRKGNKNFVIAVNKVDNEKIKKNIIDFYEFGEENFLLISAAHKKGFDELIDTIHNSIPEVEYDYYDDYIKIGILGRPNVGKSSMVNKILGYERVIVSDVPGTTRDSVDTFFDYNGKHYMIIDTAGIRRKSKINYQIERISVIRAISTIERSDVVLLMHDASEGITHQDKALAHLLDSYSKGLILVLNKWDKIKAKKEIDQEKYMKLVKKDLKYVNYAPVIKVSALTGYNVKKILKIVEKIYENQRQRIQTSVLNQFLEYILKKNSPPSFRGRQVKIKYMTQVSSNPPKFVLFCNYPDGVKDSYKKFIQNQLRANFDFEGVPIKIFFKRK